MGSESEKRRSKRYSCSVPVDSKGTGVFAGSQAVDISKGGAGIIVSNFIPIDTEMPVEIDITPEGEPILAVGKVQWIRELSQKDSYRVGISFDDVKAGSKSRLRKFFK